MRLYKITYKDKNGQVKTAARWYLDFADHQGRRRRLPGFANEQATKDLGKMIERLVNANLPGQSLDKDLIEWMENIPKSLRQRLVKMGLLSRERAAGGKTLAAHLEDFRTSLVAKGNTLKRVDEVIQKIERVFSDCQFTFYTDISANRIIKTLDGLQDTRSKYKEKWVKLSNQTFNHYLKAIKQFSRWMVQDRRVIESPLEHLKPKNTRTDRRHDRRALEPEEVRWLLETTRTEPRRFGMDGPERAMLYRLAAESGLRANELRSLKVSSFDLDSCMVSVLAAYSKHRRDDTLTLKQETTQELKAYFSGKLPSARAFNMPEKTAKMLRADLAAARKGWIEQAGQDDKLKQERQKSSFLAYVDDAGRYADFHSIRHTCGSLLAAAGVNPKVAQEIMRHSDINLTMSRYSHVYRGQVSQAVENLPDFSRPSLERQKAAATGTDDIVNCGQDDSKNYARNFAKSTGKTANSMDNNGLSDSKNPEIQNASKQALEGQKPQLSTPIGGNINNAPDRTRTCNLRFRRPMLYPIGPRAQYCRTNLKTWSQRIEIIYTVRVSLASR